MYDESFAAADLLRGDGTPAENIEAMVRALFSTWDKHEHLFRALLDARATSATVRELWDSDRESFVPVVAGMIEAERAAGAAPAGADATALATVLLELNDRMLERLALGGPLDREQLVEAVVAIWLHTIYGEVQPHEARRGHLHLRRASSSTAGTSPAPATLRRPAAGRSW